ncbi:MAG TPA: hypothetical protein ENJ37_05840 [Deltaproteobacteria bacterium]|nr:hypothetical protein [Deltaproteobacteria bacterium]
MNAAAGIAFTAGLVFYGAAAAAAPAGLVRLYRLSAAGALASHLLYILLRWRISGHPPILGTFEESLCAAWSVTLSALLMDRQGRTAAFTAPFAFLTLLYGLGFETGPRPLIISEQSLWVYFHALFAWAAYGPYTVSFAAALRILWGRGEGDGPRRILYAGLLYGLMGQTVMFVLGSYYSSLLHGALWTWDPVEYLFVVSWLVFAAAVHGRIFFGWSQRRVARWAAAGFLAAVVLYWGLVYFPWSTYHVFDPEYKIHG